MMDKVHAGCSGALAVWDPVHRARSMNMNAGNFGDSLCTWWDVVRRDRTLIIAIVMLVGALIVALVGQPEQPLWRLATVVTALSILLAMNLALGGATVPLRHRRRPLIAYLVASSALYFLALALSTGAASNVIAILLFLLVGQAAWALPLRGALLYAILMLIGVGFVIIPGNGVNVALEAMFSLSFGIVFVVMLILVTKQSERQMERAESERARAEELLTQLQASHAELRAARERELAMAAVEERIRLARDIHDGLGHYLTALNVQLQAAARLQERDPGRTAAAIAACREVAQLALDEVRRSVAAMQPSPLDGRSLDVAVERLAADFGRSTGMAAHFEQHGDLPLLPAALAQTLYRAAQEGLTNAHKHGVATQAVIHLECLPDAIRLIVRDNGEATPAPALNGGFGLAGLRERVERLGGRLQAGRDPAGGFVLEVVTPLDASG